MAKCVELQEMSFNVATYCLSKTMATATAAEKKTLIELHSSRQAHMLQAELTSTCSQLFVYGCSHCVFDVIRV